MVICEPDFAGLAERRSQSNANWILEPPSARLDVSVSSLPHASRGVAISGVAIKSDVFVTPGK